MYRELYRHVSLLTATVALAACDSPTRMLAPTNGPRLAATTENEQSTIAVSHYLVNPCASGELVLLSGYVHIVAQSTQNAAGGSKSTDRSNTQNLSAVGVTSGTVYRVVDATGMMTTDASSGASAWTSVESYRLVSRRSGDNFLVTITWHFTQNANGEPTASVVSTTTECRG